MRVKKKKRKKKEKKKKRKNEIQCAHALLSSDNDESGNVRDHVPWRFEIMRQLLNRGPQPCLPLSLSFSSFLYFSSFVRDDRHRFMRMSSPGLKLNELKL